jgi:hypothetical protein
MHYELRYQAKTHAISKKLSTEKNKIPHLLPQFYLFIFFVEKKNETEKQQEHAYGKGNNI